MLVLLRSRKADPLAVLSLAAIATPTFTLLLPTLSQGSAEPPEPRPSG